MTKSTSPLAASEQEEPKIKSSRHCSWPDKPSLPDDEFKEFRAECRKSCFAFLVCTCKDVACSLSRVIPDAFEDVNRKFH